MHSSEHLLRNRFFSSYRQWRTNIGTNLGENHRAFIGDYIDTNLRETYHAFIDDVISTNLEENHHVLIGDDINTNFTENHHVFMVIILVRI